MSGTEASGPFLIEPGYQNYAWGDPNFIPELCGIEPTGEPFAEAWYGAHVARPSMARLGDTSVALDQVIAQRAAALLGADVARRFGGLPFLLKILSASRPLSIQVHPSKEQARAGFAVEQGRGISVSSPARSYRDPNHKPELIVALTPFHAICGFRSLSDIRQRLRNAPELQVLLPPLSDASESLERLVTAYYALDTSARSAALGAWVQRLEAQGEFTKQVPEYWALSAHRQFSPPGGFDPGLFFFLLLELYELDPGQALYLEAGALHAYLEGSGVEVMANSDNVLRGGLTPKAVNVKELLKIVRFDLPQVPVLSAHALEDGRARYLTPASEFNLWSCDLIAGSPLKRTASGPEILLPLTGPAKKPAKLVAVGARLSLPPGIGCFVPHGTFYELDGEEGRVIGVSVPP